MLKRYLDKLLGSDLSLRPKQVKTRQRLLLIGGAASIGLAFLLGMGAFSKASQEVSSKEKASSSKKLDVASDSLDVRDIWADRIERRAKDTDEKAERMEAENKLLKKRLETVEDILKKATSSPGMTDNASFEGEGGDVFPGSPQGESQGVRDIERGGDFRPTRQEHEEEKGVRFASQGEIPASEFSPQKGPKILHLSLGEIAPLKNADSYVPSGTYAKAVLLSGVVVSTSQASQSNPQPVILRIADLGNLPRGFKSKLKDAILIGSCHGEISPERAICRLYKLSYVEEDGTTIEKSVQGWIFGEDGASGVRGKVVDRSGEVLREAFLAGILSGMSNFLKYESSRGIFPVTPFGQTNAMAPADAIKGSIGAGAGNAFDRAAQYGISKAEAMKPVIVIESGRVVDIVFKEGFDLHPSADTTAPLKLASHNSTSTPHQLGGF